MTINNQTSTQQGWKDGEGRLPAEPSKIVTNTNRFVKNCPWEARKHLVSCRHIPGYYICAAYDCWDIGESIKGFDLFQLSEYDFNKFVEAAVLTKPKTIKRLLNKYKKSTNNDDLKP